MNHMKTGKRVSKVDILGAIYDYLHEITARNDEHFTWGDGDSLDRERGETYLYSSMVMTKIFMEAVFYYEQ